MHADRVACILCVVLIIWIGTILQFFVDLSEISKLFSTPFNVADIILILLKYKILTFTIKILRNLRLPNVLGTSKIVRTELCK